MRVVDKNEATKYLEDAINEAIRIRYMALSGLEVYKKVH